MPLYKTKTKTHIAKAQFKSPVLTTNIFKSLKDDYKTEDNIFQSSDSGMENTPKQSLESNVGISPQKKECDVVTQKTLTLQSIDSDQKQNQTTKKLFEVPTKVVKHSRKRNFKPENDLSFDETNSVISDILSQGSIRDTDLSSEVMNHPEVKSLFINFVKKTKINGRKTPAKSIKKQLTICSSGSEVKIRQKVVKKQATGDNKREITVLSKKDKPLSNNEKILSKNPNKSHSRNVKWSQNNFIKNDKEHIREQKKKTTKPDLLNNGEIAPKNEFKNNMKDSNKNKENPVKLDKKSSKAQNIKIKRNEISHNEYNIEPKYLKEDGKNALNMVEEMEWLMNLRNVGLYVFCDYCNKMRYLPTCKDPLELPDKWYCFMNPDSKYNKCTDPNVDISPEDTELLIDNEYNAGSIVWAKMEGYPWWPAMVEDDPDIQDYFWLENNSNKPTWYHVTFFDSDKVTRAWIRTNDLKPYKINSDNPIYTNNKFNKFQNRVVEAMKQASEACELNLLERLKKYSFIYRYDKPMNCNSKSKKKTQKSTKTCKEKKLKVDKKQRHTKNKTTNDDNKNCQIPEGNKISKNEEFHAQLSKDKAEELNENEELGKIGKKTNKFNFLSNLSFTLSEISDFADDVKSIEENFLCQEFSHNSDDELLL